ncbi:MAG: response regulator [Spirochaetaceae bacterium]|jgi:CheY-like chemotaxis protein|nr:response regulator [Spirochaetaceae bacterium]GMO17945.1 MAG: hypothetical protein Pg6A_04620 [Termitinemataceae bacterium]
MEKSEKRGRPIILAVDDSPVNLRTVKVFLEAKYDVIPVKSGILGLNALKGRKIDLILLDIDMPLMSGFDFLKQLKQIPEKSGIPVICITGLDATPELIAQVIKSGAKDFLTKPFEPDTLMSKISRVLHNEWRF